MVEIEFVDTAYMPGTAVVVMIILSPLRWSVVDQPYPPLPKCFEAF